MAAEIRVPALGESVTEATIGQWFKKVGDAVAADEPVVELETDKVTIEVPAPSAGVLESISANPGDTVNVGALIGAIGGRCRRCTAPKAEAEACQAGVQAGTGAAGSGRPCQQWFGQRCSAAAPAAAKLMAENGIADGTCRFRQARPGAQGRCACRHVKASAECRRSCTRSGWCGHAAAVPMPGATAAPAARTAASPAPAPAPWRADRLRPATRRAKSG